MSMFKVCPVSAGFTREFRKALEGAFLLAIEYGYLPPKDTFEDDPVDHNLRLAFKALALISRPMVVCDLVPQGEPGTEGLAGGPVFVKIVLHSESGQVQVAFLTKTGFHLAAIEAYKAYQTAHPGVVLETSSPFRVPPQSGSA